MTAKWASGFKRTIWQLSVQWVCVDKRPSSLQRLLLLFLTDFSIWMSHTSRTLALQKQPVERWHTKHWLKWCKVLVKWDTNMLCRNRREVRFVSFSVSLDLNQNIFQTLQLLCNNLSPPPPLASQNLLNKTGACEQRGKLQHVAMAPGMQTLSKLINYEVRILFRGKLHSCHRK